MSPISQNQPDTPLNCYVILLAAGSGSRLRDALLKASKTQIQEANNLCALQEPPLCDAQTTLYSHNSHNITTHSSNNSFDEHTFSSQNFPNTQNLLKKQFIPYQNAPLWWQSVLTFHSCPQVQGMVLVFPDDDTYDATLEDAKKRHKAHNLSFPFYFARGGKMRHHSVYNGLNALPKDRVDCLTSSFSKNPITHLLVHDSARPFFSSTLVHKLLETMHKNPHIHALIPAITVNDTIKMIKVKQKKEIPSYEKKSQESLTAITPSQKSDSIISMTCTQNSEHDTYEIVTSTPDRHLLRAVQTPQAFSIKELIETHQIIHELESKNDKVSLKEKQNSYSPIKIIKNTDSFSSKARFKDYKEIPTITDDAMMMEFCGHTVYLINGEEKNVKITNPKDLALLETQKQRIPCSGYGYDVHRFGGDRPFMLGGISIPTELKIQAHSDGDVLLHALMDALLSCLCLGDIGTHFPDSDKKFENISSSLLLDHVMGLWQKSGLLLCHVDLTIITQKPKIAPFAKEITKNVARLLSISPTCINTKATTEEKLGFTGEGKGIKAVALVSALK